MEYGWIMKIFVKRIAWTGKPLISCHIENGFQVLCASKSLGRAEFFVLSFYTAHYSVWRITNLIVWGEKIWIILYSDSSGIKVKNNLHYWISWSKYRVSQKSLGRISFLDFFSSSLAHYLSGKLIRIGIGAHQWQNLVSYFEVGRRNPFFLL